MSLGLGVLGWCFALLFSTPWWIALYDWAWSRWQSKHRPPWPPESLYEKELK